MYIYYNIIFIYIYFSLIESMSTSKEAIDNLDRGTGGYNFIYPWKFWTKQSFFQGNSAKLCYTYCKSKTKNQDHWKLHMNFS